MFRRIRIAYLYLLFPLFATAQTFHFANYSVKDGLAQSNVSGIVQDSSGFYWIATEGGISRFDGKNFLNYTTENGLSDNNVSALFLDRSNHLWMGHENGTLTRFDGETFSSIKSRLLPKDKKIYSFFQDSQGSLWVSTATGGVIKIVDPSKSVSENSSMHIRVYSGRDGLSNYVFTTCEDKDGNLWFLTDIGIKILYRSTRRFEFFRPAGMPLGQITSLTNDGSGNFLMGTTNGSVYRYNTQKGNFETVISPSEAAHASGSVGPNFIFAILQDSKRNVWASGSNHGIYRYERVSGRVNAFNTSNGLAVNKVRCILEDKEGNILFGTSGEGIQVFSGERFVSFSKSNGLLDNQVWAICKDHQNRLWFGTNEGITIYDPSQSPDKAYSNLTIKDGLPSNNVRSIISDRSGNMWIGTWGGRAVKYDTEHRRLMNYPALADLVNPLVSSLLADRRGFIWIGTVEGIVVYDPSTQSIMNYRTIHGLSDNDISCLFEDSKGRIWIGTKQKGVTMFDGKEHPLSIKKGFSKFGREHGLTYASISAITEDGKDRIWVATEGGGAFVMKGNSFTNYKTAQGLISDYITLAASDNRGNIWFGTNKGLNRFETDKGTFSTYQKGDGFTGVETKSRAAYRDNAGNVWFGTVNGAFKYDPSKDVPLSSKPITRILKFRVGVRDYPIQRFTELSYKDNSLSFDYIGVSLANPEGVVYKIRLEGYDDDWKTTNQSSVVYSNLPHNKYVFKLIACNTSGVCSDPVELKITVTPPYWKTWWFYLIVISAVVGTLFVYIKLRERKLMNEKRKLEAMVNERTAEVVEKNKELDEINKDITASIRYAKRIQDAILPPDDYVRKHLPNTFVLFKPKDIVSGDFYWMDDRENSVIVAAVDCTGHGVPGAFMSIVGHNLLDRVVTEQNLTQPAQILDELNRSLTWTLRQKDLEDNTVRDGMDISLCTFHRDNGLLEFAGAYNPLWLVREKEVIEVKANKFPIGNSKAGDTKKFTNHKIPLRHGDTVYIFSDGFADQFGGASGKKFKSAAFKQLLISAQHLNMEEQRELLNRTIEEWRGNHEQVDDILVIGIRYTGPSLN
jgi:ligand-binding sensor domain-containing protein/serine phosphatase RsbU (regulator of sigma subunit)